MPKLRGGCFTVVTILLSVFLFVLALAYLVYPFYLVSPPSAQSICGTWVIDPDLTTGYEASAQVQADHLHHGCLELKPDGRFTTQLMPQFWGHQTSSYKPSSASGTWRFAVDNHGWAMLNLDFEQIDDKKAGDWDWGHSYIRRKGSDYVLYFIMDFDSSDFLVLHKSP